MVRLELARLSIMAPLAALLGGTALIRPLLQFHQMVVEQLQVDLARLLAQQRLAQPEPRKLEEGLEEQAALQVAAVVAARAVLMGLEPRAALDRPLLVPDQVVVVPIMAALEERQSLQPVALVETILPVAGVELAALLVPETA